MRRNHYSAESRAPSKSSYDLSLQSGFNLGSGNSPVRPAKNRWSMIPIGILLATAAAFTILTPPVSGTISEGLRDHLNH